MDLLTLAIAKSLSGGTQVGIDTQKSTSDKSYFNFTLDDIKNGKSIIVEVEGSSSSDPDTYYYPEKIVVTKDAQGTPTSLEVFVSDSQYNETYYIDDNGGIYQYRTITYKSADGSTTLFTEQVCIGGTGTKENTETKPSTVQYDYVPYGWALTANGEHDDDALTDVTTDRTVYAAFSAVLRSYDISFYNTISVNEEDNDILVDETDDLITQENSVLIHTQSVNYGEVPVYDGTTPTQDETDTYTYTFSGWTPTLVAVTGEASYLATYTKTAK